MKPKSDATVEPTSQESTAKALTFEHVPAPLSTDLRIPAMGVVGGGASAAPRRGRAGASAPARPDEATRSRSRRTTPRAAARSSLIIAIDTESQQSDGGNRILSYQWAAQVPGAQKWTGILNHRAGRRMKLSELLSVVITAGLASGHLRAWPSAITLVAHFSLADLSTFSDFPQLKVKFDSLRGTYVSLQQPVVIKVYDGHRHAHSISATLRDTFLLAPGVSKALAKLGEMHGLPKLDLPDGAIEHMEELQTLAPGLFEEYALRDPQICLAHALKLLELNQELTGVAEVPVTLTALATGLLLSLWTERGISRHLVLGTCEETVLQWNPRTQRSLSRTLLGKVDERHLNEALAVECYHGGRNEAFSFGAGAPGHWQDLDLASAYTTAMACLGMPIWAESRHTLGLDDFSPTTLGFARVLFAFPPDTRFPCLPVRTEHGLIFPLNGTTYVCAPEIALARRLGATLKILHGVVIPHVDGVRPFELFASECIARRKSFKKGGVENELWKELANSTYGALAQGSRPKLRFDSRTGQHHTLPPSKISNPYLAAWVTSFVRAVVGEILHALPATVAVCSVTTDGFLTSASDKDIAASTNGDLCSMFAAARQRLTGNSGILEVKHRIRQPLCFRTRGQATLEPEPGSADHVLAKAGIKPPLKDKAMHNDWLVTLFLDRIANTRVRYARLRSLLDLHRDGGDLVQVTAERRAGLDFDFKREPMNSVLRDIRGIPHVAFETRPWPNVDAFLKCRADWDVFRRQRVLKTITDLEDFRAFCATPPGRAVRTTAPRGAVKVALRMFLRAFVRDRWGLDSRVMNYPELAAWLTAAGYPCRREDVENARRSSTKLSEHSVAGTEAVLKFISVVTAQFPGFQAHHLLIPDSVPGQFPRL